jgi:hypothetical protein
MAETVTERIGEAVVRARSGDSDAREVVDQTFDVFGRQGAGALAAWMILSGDRDALDPILTAIRDLVDQLTTGHERHGVAELTLKLVLAALGDSLLGEPITAALGLDRDAARAFATESLRRQIEAHHPVKP